MRTTNGVVSLLIALTTAGTLTSCSVVSDRETMGEYVDDTSITTKVKAAILKDNSLAPFQIHVETMQSVVLLSGFVDSKLSAVKAEELAWKVTGVRNVKNNLVVRSAKARGG